MSVKKINRLPPRHSPHKQKFLNALPRGLGSLPWPWGVRRWWTSSRCCGLWAEASRHPSRCVWRKQYLLSTRAVMCLRRCLSPPSEAAASASSCRSETSGRCPALSGSGRSCPGFLRKWRHRTLIIMSRLASQWVRICVRDDLWHPLSLFHSASTFF